MQVGGIQGQSRPPGSTQEIRKVIGPGYADNFSPSPLPLPPFRARTFRIVAWDSIWEEPVDLQLAATPIPPARLVVDPCESRLRDQ